MLPWDEDERMEKLNPFVFKLCYYSYFSYTNEFESEYTL